MWRQIELGRSDCNFRVKARFFARIVLVMTLHTRCVVASPDPLVGGPSAGQALTLQSGWRSPNIGSIVT